MSKPGWLDARAIIAGLAITAATASLGAAVDVRDRVAKQETYREMDNAVQGERDARILSDLAAIKTRLGIVP